MEKIKYKGGGIIPVSIHNGKVFLLLGRENKYCKDGAGKYCDFGGGNDGEDILENVARECAEETLGFLGNKDDIKKKIKNCDVEFSIGKEYVIYFMPIMYNEILPEYFNNSQKIIQEYIPKKILSTNKIYEKDKMRWFSINDLINKKNELRKWFKITSKEIISKHNKIKKFIIHCTTKEKDLEKQKTKKIKRKKTKQTKKL
jgi:hypothetical protein